METNRIILVQKEGKKQVGDWTADYLTNPYLVSYSTHAKRIARLHPRQSWLKVPRFLQKKPKSKVTTQHSKSRPEGTTGEKTTKKNVDTTSNDKAPVPQKQPLTGMDKFRIVVDVIGVAGTIMYPVSMFMPPLGGGKNGAVAAVAAMMRTMTRVVTVARVMKARAMRVWLMLADVRSRSASSKRVEREIQNLIKSRSNSSPSPSIQGLPP
ncbi:hypothetical protein FRC03_006294 [Tulasnella sp. 419]|nr:hypothetical protein FRC03_006294 [Tulasnella sp. 419]